MSETKKKILEILNTSSRSNLVATTKAGSPSSTALSLELARMMLKRREKGLKMKAIAAQSTASYGLAQQPTFLHASILNTCKNTYDLFAAKMLQLSNAEIYSKFNRRRQTPIQQNVCGDDGDVGKNKCACDYKTPYNRQKLRQNILNSKCVQHRKLKQIRSSEQTISLQYRPSIDGVATAFKTALEVELVAAPEIAVNGSVAQNPTATMRSDIDAYICADADKRTTAKNAFASTLLSKEALFHTNVNITSSHDIIPSTLKIGKPIKITTALKTSLLSLVRNAFLMIALILTVLTLQRVSGQYLLSIASTSAAATATTTRTARDVGVTTIIPVSSTTVKNMFDITETNYIQPHEPQKIKLRRQNSTQKQPISYDVRKSNHHSDFSRVSAAKLQNANKHNNSQIKFSKLIYNNYKKRKFFNEEQIEVRQQKIIELQQRRRSKRGTVESIVTQLKSNNTESEINSNKNSKNYRTFKSELSGNSKLTTNRYNIKFTVEDSKQKTRSANDQKLLKLVMDGLGLEQLPNMKKINISQREYVTKYREYLRRVHDRKRRELAQSTYAIGKAEQELESAPLRIVSIAPNVTKYETYLRRKRNTQSFLDNFPLTKHEVTDAETVSNNFVLPRQQRNNNRKFRQERTTMILHFALETNAAQLQPGDVEEANIRLMIIHSSTLAVKPNKKKQKSKNRSCGSSVEKSGKDHANATAANDKQKHLLNLKVYQRLRNGKRVCLDSSKVNIEIDQSRKYDTHSQWVQFDVTKAVETWLREERSNLGLEVQCDNCQRVGARILNDMSSPTNVDDGDVDGAQLMPILNIIGHLGVSYKEIRSNKHSNSVEKPHHYYNVATFSNGQQRPIGAIDKLSCHKFNQRCCRHTMEVIFKEIKGFEFIIQPKVFDAGYCHGRCPPRYNPAHHHAMLQSLIWKQNRERAPRPCCAPSKLVELEVLHVDEKDSEKLKISTWTDMRVVECACS